MVLLVDPTGIFRFCKATRSSLPMSVWTKHPPKEPASQAIAYMISLHATWCSCDEQTSLKRIEKTQRLVRCAFESFPLKRFNNWLIWNERNISKIAPLQIWVSTLNGIQYPQAISYSYYGNRSILGVLRVKGALMGSWWWRTGHAVRYLCQNHFGLLGHHFIVW